MPELVKEYASFNSVILEHQELQPSPTRERYLVLALTALLAINLVVIFGALTFYYLLVRK